jgi:hypothetical protein
VTDDYVLTEYPPGPYGFSQGSVIANLEFKGWHDPVAAGYDPANFETVRLSDFYDPSGETYKLILLNASAVWCSVCRAEYQHMHNEGIYATYRPKGVQLIGALFDSKDERTPVVVLSESLWRQRFGADQAVLGRTVQFDGEPHAIVAVLPDRLSYPDRQARAWIPLYVPPVTGNAMSMFEAVGRLRAGTTAAQAAAEGTARGRFAAKTGLTTVAIFGNDGPLAIDAQPLQEALTVDVRRPLIVLLVAVGLLAAGLHDARRVVGIGGARVVAVQPVDGRGQ